MRILVTGGTGFVGCHTVAALHGAGHTVRLLVRDESKVPKALAGVGLDVDEVEVVRGDVTDPGSVEVGLDGCSGVVHAAGVVGTDATATQRMQQVNVEGSKTVLGLAIANGCGPIVHVSSAAALFPHSGDTVSPDDPPGTHPAAYASTKSAADAAARLLQAQGHPIVLTYPTGVTGPHDPAQGSWIAGVQYWFERGIPRGDGLAAAFVDVRDLAAMHASIFGRPPAPGRFLAWGHRLTFDQLAEQIEAVTGTKLRRPPMPKLVMTSLGKGGDLARRLGRNPTITSDVVAYLYGTKPADQRATATELGISPRPFRETISDALVWMCSERLLTEEQLGLLADV